MWTIEKRRAVKATIQSLEREALEADAKAAEYGAYPGIKSQATAQGHRDRAKNKRYAIEVLQEALDKARGEALWQEAEMERLATQAVPA